MKSTTVECTLDECHVRFLVRGYGYTPGYVEKHGGLGSEYFMPSFEDGVRVWVVDRTGKSEVEITSTLSDADKGVFEDALIQSMD